jgi:hypothetical protein
MSSFIIIAFNPNAIGRSSKEMLFAPSAFRECSACFLIAFK